MQSMTARHNKPFNWSAQRRRRWVPVALRAPAPGERQRYADGRSSDVRRFGCVALKS